MLLWRPLTHRRLAIPYVRIEPKGIASTAPTGGGVVRNWGMGENLAQLHASVGNDDINMSYSFLMALLWCPYTFQLKDSSGLKPYVNGGVSTLYPS